jgi:hypothetical protein
MTASEDDATVRITNREIYNAVLDLKEAVNPLPGQVSDHEVRIRAIEKYLWIWIGAAGVLGAGVSQVATRLLTG